MLDDAILETANLSYL